MSNEGIIISSSNFDNLAFLNVGINYLGDPVVEYRLVRKSLGDKGTLISLGSKIDFLFVRIEF